VLLVATEETPLDERERVVRETAKGETPTFEAIYDEHFAFVWRSARRLGVQESAQDDVAQEVFVVVHARLAQFEGRSSIKTWLFGILVHVVRNHRRTIARKQPHEAHDDEGRLEFIHDDASRGPHERAVKAEALRTLHAVLDGLDDDKREVFVLAELEQMSAPEIAIATGANVNTVYSRLRMARREFEESLARHKAREERSEP
jgi:RNA polymerase sigma-70 factor, ECF subfamily